MARAFLFVLDSFGIGGAADAARFGDAGSNTFGHIAEACAAGKRRPRRAAAGPLDLPNMMSLGLGQPRRCDRAMRDAAAGDAALPVVGFHGAAQEVSSGKDTPSGHWEIAGVPVPFDWGYFPHTVPTFPPT